MAYAIIDTCTKDNHCIEACPVNCIHPTPDEPDYETAPHLYVHPEECIDCGACVPVCPTTSVFPVEEVPADKLEYIEINAKYFVN
jgi:NAD-dependent dihydropyrimidine dehydrogenase PreA subunit